MRREELPPYDVPEQKTFPAKISGQDMELDIGNCALALFRQRPFMDYLAVLMDEGEESESWVMVFDRQELIYWMGGIALTQHDREDVRRANGKNGSFRDRYGWNPDVVIEDYPSGNEVDVYVSYVTNGIDTEAIMPEAEDEK